ncbi:MAG: hypothetical protein F9K23_01925 [Bacteroidetes bacterium]|nr:MAG: hypothetical protein F9K23_01925 [Bacteroidota bacterium]
MATQNNHIINKQTLKIQVGDMAAATTVNQSLQQWLQAEMPRVLNDLLDSYAGDETVYIDRLELSLDFKNISDFKSRFISEFKQQLQKQLTRRLTSSHSHASNTVLPVQKANAGKSSWETLLFYLQNGTFPWWYNDENHTRLLQDVFDQWENTVQQKSDAAKQVKQLLLQPLYFQRFVELTPQNSFKRLVTVLGGEDATQLLQLVNKLVTTGIAKNVYWCISWVCFPLWVTHIKNQPQTLETITSAMSYWLQQTQHHHPILQQNAITFLQQEAVTPIDAKTSGTNVTILQTAAYSLLRTITAQQAVNDGEPKDGGNDAAPTKNGSSPKKTAAKTLSTKGDKVSADAKPNNKTFTEGIRVQNSGLVLIWPYLGRLFETTGYLTDGVFTDVAAQHKAVLLLHYLVYKQLPEDESLLVLAKILCGMHPAETVSVKGEIDEKWDEIRTELWNAVRNNWDKLKNTSIEGLIESFVIREGILKSAPATWQLTVERKTIDVLMSSLPWPISVIKLKWSKELLTVAW